MRELTGTVVYRERIALLPDAAVHVALSAVDVDEPIAELTQPVDGAQVPIAFTLAYPESQIDEGRAYVVTAEIRQGGRTAFVTGDPVAVITQGRPDRDVAIRVHTNA